MDKTEPLVGVLDHVVLYVPDVPRAVKHYTDAFGWKKLFGSDDFAGVSAGQGPWLGLRKSTDREPVAPIPFFRVKDMKTAMWKLGGRGVTFADVKEVPGGVFATTRDSVGNRIGLFERRAQ